ncbi:unnamed protein product [Heligmosomoides polygyrus]|uniref:DUF5753 domain-containing protein n=1 Tax=Heligmosomoides polygyrus TaxID=6339 RepID=A0A183FDW6_HELPZ|nr:unnamed protein product [Heligmosomoides polygyrus]
MVVMSVPPRGATGNCSLLQAELNTATRMQATGPCDKLAYEQPMSHHMVDGAMFHDIVLRRPREPTHLRYARGVWKVCEDLPGARAASGETVLV